MFNSENVVQNFKVDILELHKWEPHISAINFISNQPALLQRCWDLVFLLKHYRYNNQNSPYYPYD